MAETATVNRVKCLEDGGIYYDWRTSGTFYIGYGYLGEHNLVTVAEFTITKPCKKLHIDITNGSVQSVNRTFNLAIQPQESDTYGNANYTTPSNGTITLSQYNFTSAQADIDITLAAGTYYLYIYTTQPVGTDCYSQVSHNANGHIIITYDELQGAARIDGGAALDLYSIWIDNGAAFEQYVPYIDNGSTFELYGG